MVSYTSAFALCRINLVQEGCNATHWDVGFTSYWVLQKCNCYRERVLFAAWSWASGNRTQEMGVVLPCPGPAVLCHLPFTLSPVTAHTQVPVNWVRGVAFMTAALSCKHRENTLV